MNCYKFQLIAIDLDDTLLDYRKEEDKVVVLIARKISKIFGLSHSDAIALYTRAKEQERAFASPREIISYRFEYIARVLTKSTNNSSELFVLYKQYREDNCCLKTGALELLETVADLTDNIVIITNGLQELQERRCEVTGISDKIDQIYSSSRINYSKPTGKFFDRVAEISNTNISDWFVIGNDYSMDLYYPRRCKACVALIGGVFPGIYCAPTPQELIPTIKKVFYA